MATIHTTGVTSNITMLATRAIATGAVGGGISYFVLKRNDVVDIFGTELPHYAADALLLIASSAAGNILSSYVLPFTEQKMGLSPAIQNFVNVSVAPALCGGVSAFGKVALVSPSSEDSKLTDFLLGAGSKLAGDRLSEMWQ